MRFLRPLILLTAAFAGTAQAQQPAIGVPPSLEVQRLAPQLVNFFGSSANFQNLVNGLASGTPITLTSVGADGLTRVVTFTPGSTLPPLQIAQTLESARQALISRGIATPSAEQTAVTLVGGNLQTATGIVPTTALVPTTTSTTTAASTSASVGTGSAAAGGTVPSPAITVQQQGTPTGPTTSGNTSDSLRTRPISDSPPTPLPATPAGTPDSTITATPAPAASAPLAGTTPGTTALPGGAVATPPATTATGTTTPPSSASTPSAIRR